MSDYRSSLNADTVQCGVTTSEANDDGSYS